MADAMQLVGEIYGVSGAMIAFSVTAARKVRRIRVFLFGD